MSVRYAVDERVLCWHQDLVYEAKVLEVKREAETPEYYVHYKGWKNTYVKTHFFYLNSCPQSKLDEWDLSFSIDMFVLISPLFSRLKFLSP